MQGQGVVFVTGDRLGDQLAGLLEAEGCQVIRGPKPHPPRSRHFPKRIGRTCLAKPMCLW